MNMESSIVSGGVSQTVIVAGAVCIGSLLLLFLSISKLFAVLRSPLRKIPGPFYAQFTDLVLLLTSFRGDKLHYLHNLNIKYGPIVRVTPNSVLLGDPHDIKTVFSSHREFGKGPWYEGRGGENAIITNRDDKDHAWRRRLFGHVFSNTEVRKFESVVREKVRLATDRIGEESRKQGYVDVLKWYTFMATDIIGDLSFGDSFRMLERGKKDEYIAQLENIMFAETIRLDLPILYRILKLLRIFTLITKAEVAGFAEYGTESIQRLRRLLIAAGTDNARPTFFTHVLLDEKQKGLSNAQISQQAAEFIFAGSDTTSNSMAFLIWAVAQNPSIKRRLTEEVSALPENYSLAALENLPYLNAVLMENLRVYGPASGDLPREIRSDGHNFQGYFLPRGTGLEVQTHTMHRSPLVFQDPERFDPDRWLNASSDMKACFLPFGGSSRICLGIHLAYMELRLATTEFFRKYPNVELTKDMTAADMEIVNYAVNSPAGKRMHVRV